MVSQVPQGVGAPAQFVFVPLMEMKCSSKAPLESTIIVVHPPGDLGSYAVSGTPITVPAGMSLPSPSSWLRTIL